MPSKATNTLLQKRKDTSSKDSESPRCSAHSPHRRRLVRDVVRSRAAEIPRPNIREFALLRQHGNIGSDIRDIRAERAKVRVVRDVAASSISL
jgi:hypothetical protein